MVWLNADCDAPVLGRACEAAFQHNSEKHAGS
jgi:hypothetical protein